MAAQFRVQPGRVTVDPRAWQVGDAITWARLLRPSLRSPCLINETDS
jgi:hypothetical protein